MARRLTLGLDYGTDSVRALLVDVATGKEVAAHVCYYPRWKQGKFCDPVKQQFRQHPLDYLESLEVAVKGALKAAGKDAGKQVIGIGIDTTGSTPIAVDKNGQALALRKEFANDPDAMFILWKDHTAVAEAEEINALAHGGKFPDYTKYVGGIYSSEWFWAKILRTLRANKKVAKEAYTWVEHCDWLPAVLTGANGPDEIVRGRCSAGHKALWHEEWGGLPAEDFLVALDKKLAGLRDRLFTDTFTSDKAAGSLTKEWAKKLGLSEGIAVAVGAFDCHLGAVGAGLKPYHLARVMGTSTCDMLVAPPAEVEGTLVRGICGQVDGSIVPGMIGFEAGQSAFGDVYAWYKRLIAWPAALGTPAQRKAFDAVLDGLLPALEKAAGSVPPGANGTVAVDWFNGRRTPDADQRLKGAIAGLHLGTDAPTVYRALIEATAFGSKAIIDRFIDQGIRVDGVVALGGIAQKSKLVMQICADVFARPIQVVESDQCCALGSAIMAAVAAGAYSSVAAAQKKMASKIMCTYKPGKQAKDYAVLADKYRALGAYVEAASRPAVLKAAKA
jgi:L-ribulokinase